MPLRFKRSSRLHQSKDFTRIFKTGRRFKRYCLTIYASPTLSPSDGSRLGVVVPKKAVALATRRHRVKRIIRESFRLHQAHLIKLDIVILMMRGFSFNDKRLWQTLEQIWLELKAPCSASS